MAERIPKRSVHIADRYGVERVQCGRKADWKGRFHRSWPTCKTCLKVLATKGESWSVMATYYDEMYPDSLCMLPAVHDPESGHLSDTKTRGFSQRVRWWPVQGLNLYEVQGLNLYEVEA